MPVVTVSVRRYGCEETRIVAFSCKGRGFCRSIWTRSRSCRASLNRCLTLAFSPSGITKRVCKDIPAQCLSAPTCECLKSRDCPSGYSVSNCTNQNDKLMMG
jgi:hypothetical protein